MISWVFYDININYQHNGDTGAFTWINAFTFLGQIWIYQFIFTLCLIAICGGMWFIVFGLYNIYDIRVKDDRGTCVKNGTTITLLILGGIMCSCGTIIAPLFMEIVNYIFIAVIPWILIDDELPS